MRPTRLLLCAVIFWGVGCDESGGDLVVSLRTDLVPGVEFFSVETQIEELEGTVETRTARIGDAFADGLRVAEYTAVAPGTRTVLARVLDEAGVEVASTRVRVEHGGAARSVVVLLSRDCRSVGCASAGPPLSACYGGACVDPSCETGDEVSCPEPECESEADCTDRGSCSSAVCVGGLCFYRGLDSMCQRDEFCRPQGDCESLPTADAGPPDAGATDSGMQDAGDACADGVENGTETDVDCGGDCAPCPDGDACRLEADCVSGVCEAEACIPCVDNAACTLPLPCANGVQRCGAPPVCEVGASVMAGAACGGGMCDGSGLCELLPDYPPIVPGSSVVGMGFGFVLALDGTRLAVGAPRDTEGAVLESGSVWIYERPGAAWDFQTRLTVERNMGGPIEFGKALSLFGDRLAVGAVRSFDSTGEVAGVVEVFERAAPGAWPRLTVIDRPMATRNGDSFGNGVAIEGDRVIGGAAGRDDLPTGFLDNAGTAWVFERAADAWPITQELTRPGPRSRDFYGVSAALQGDTAVIGANIFDSRSAPGFASVQTFDGSAWTERSRLASRVGLVDDSFGVSVDIDGDWIVVGAPTGGDGLGGREGVASAFRRQTDGTWRLTEELSPSDPEDGVRFGHCVSLAGDLLVVGAYQGTSGAVPNSGTAYVYRRDDIDRWLPLARLAPTTPETGAEFGVGCALSGTTIAIGAQFDDRSGTVDAGAVYVFELAGL